MHEMGYLIGTGLAIAVGIFAGLVRFDRERGFYPVVLIVIASLYAFFAIIAGATDALAMEALPALAFIGAAVAGFRRSLWFAVAGLALHGVFDAFHHAIIDNPGVPAWWPEFCLAYDVTAAVYLAVLLRIGRTPSASA